MSEITGVSGLFDNEVPMCQALWMMAFVLNTRVTPDVHWSVPGSLSLASQEGR